jgi:hypothetical protein
MATTDILRHVACAPCHQPRAKRLLSIVTGNDDSDDSDDDELQTSVQSRQARAAHIMTSALGTGPSLVMRC